jgi:hypothetical protein
MILKMIWNRYTLKILTDLIFLIYFFFQPKSSFITDNEVEIQYLGLCDDELEDDFEAIQSQVLHHDLQETTFEIKSRISSDDYKDKVSKMLSTFNKEIFMRLIFAWSSLLKMGRSIH